jgi:hypothetical protein
MSTGTHTVADLLANQDIASRRVAEFGEPELVQPVRDALDAHNAAVQEMMRKLAVETVERQETYGAETGGDMQRADEFTRAPTQKAARKGKVAYPFDLFQHPVGFTREYILRATVGDFLLRELNGRSRHLTRIRREIKRALFSPTNETFYDYLTDDLDLIVRRLVNGDGEPIPGNDAGVTFDASTHSHYRGTTSVSGSGLETALKAMIDDVAEHDHVDGMEMNVARENEAVVRALPSFLPYVEQGVVAGTAEDRANGTAPNRLTNRPIGRFHGAEVWTRTWVPADYYQAYAAADPNKPLRMRVDPLPQLRGLQLAAKVEIFPLRADFYEARFGIGVRNRTNSAVLYANAGSGGVYTAPAGL